MTYRNVLHGIARVGISILLDRGQSWVGSSCHNVDGTPTIRAKKLLAVLLLGTEESKVRVGTGAFWATPLAIIQTRAWEVIPTGV